MNKWRWGNFDKEETFINNSFGASLQAQKMIIWRTSLELLNRGDTERAVAITDKYFEAFPHFNFPYTARTLPHLNIYLQAKEYDKLKTHMRILVEEMADYMEFYDSLSDADLKSGFSLDYQLSIGAIQDALRVSKQVNDEAFAQEVETLVGSYASRVIKN
jgi:hypothetical protein